MSSIADRIELVRQTMTEAANASGRRTEDIKLLGVSKKQPIERLQAAYAAGLCDFGENYVQGLEEHACHFGGLSSPSPRWHFIGQLQSNKAKRILGVSLFHSLDSVKLGRVLAKHALAANITQDCLVNVNISKQETKSGVSPEDLEGLLATLGGFPGINILGLMCIPSPDEDARTAFSRLRTLLDSAKKNTDFPLCELSMGMSSSYVDAIAEGATIVRVGTQLFGPRT